MDFDEKVVNRYLSPLCRIARHCKCVSYFYVQTLLFSVSGDSAFVNMRLVHAETIRLKEFPENELPPYAILSHTWEKDEVFFLDLDHLILELE